MLSSKSHAAVLINLIFGGKHTQGIDFLILLKSCKVCPIHLQITNIIFVLMFVCTGPRL